MRALDSTSSRRQSEGQGSGSAQLAHINGETRNGNSEVVGPVDVFVANVRNDLCGEEPSEF